MYASRIREFQKLYITMDQVTECYKVDNEGFDHEFFAHNNCSSLVRYIECTSDESFLIEKEVISVN